MIRTQIHTHGLSLDIKPKEVVERIVQQHKAAQEERFGVFPGFPHRDMEKEIEHTQEVVDPYINWGRWCADCPYCNSGMAITPGVGDCVCLDCGRTYKVSPLPSKDVKEAESALLVREDPVDRNWYPDRESVKNLKEENSRRGSK